MSAPHVDTLRKFQRHQLLRQFGDDGQILPENLEVSRALDALFADANKLFNLLEGVCDRIEAAGHREKANKIRAGFARATGGVDVPFLIEEFARSAA